MDNIPQEMMTGLHVKAIHEATLKDAHKRTITNKKQLLTDNLREVYAIEELFILQRAITRVLQENFVSPPKQKSKPPLFKEVLEDFPDEED